MRDRESTGNEGDSCVSGLWSEEHGVVLEEFSEDKVRRLRALLFEFVQADGNCLASQLPRKSSTTTD